MRTAAAILLILAGLAIVCVGFANAHDARHPDFDGWYRSLMRPNVSGYSGPAGCCDVTDCHETDAYLKDGYWWARLGKPVFHGAERDWELLYYVQVPDDVVLKGKDNPTGYAVICHEITWTGSTFAVDRIKVLCFVPGFET